MPIQSTDFYGHDVNLGGTQLTAGAVGTSATGTISATATAGSTSTVTVTDANDRRGQFLLNSVGTGQTAGANAIVKFAKEYPAIPIVVLSMQNETDSLAAIVAAPGTVTTAGFTVYIGTAVTAGKAYRINYMVVPGGSNPNV